MGKAANLKRRMFFEELAARDNTRRKRKAEKRKRKTELAVAKSSCCMSRRDLPMFFLACVDCPVNRVAALDPYSRRV